MSVNRLISLSCDGCGARTLNDVSVGRVRSAVKLLGWTRKRGKDYCKPCSDRQPQKVSQQNNQII